MLEMIPSLAGRCDFADNGRAAVKLVQQSVERCRTQPGSHYSLILLDYSMPEMDGPTTAVEICKLFSEENKSNNTTPLQPYIVCLTAFTEIKYQEIAFKSGMSAFVTKPLGMPRLKEMLVKTQLVAPSDFEEKKEK